MEKEVSEDSYCTTDEGEQEESEKEHESEPNPQEINDQIGQSIPIKSNTIIKEILHIGQSINKPVDIDNVVISSRCFFHNDDGDGLLNVPIYEFNQYEVSLEDPSIPRSLALAIQSMRKQEKTLIFIKFKYIFKHFDILIKPQIETFPDMSIFFDTQFREKNINNKITFEVTLHDFFIVQNLMDKGEIRKKILVNGNSWRYARHPDVVVYDLSCKFKGEFIYQKWNATSELDRELGNTLFEIEHRILENVKPGEYAEISVKPSYMKDRNSQFITHYGIDNSEDTIFLCEVKSVDAYEYIFKATKDKISKKKVLNKGMGKDMPDRESIVKMKLQIKINSEIVFNNFETQDVMEYLSLPASITFYQEWRNKINREMNIDNPDDENQYPRDKQIFDMFPLQTNIVTADLRLYSLPILLRKVLVHMKRNEVAYIRTNYIDFFLHDQCEIKDIGLCNINPNNVNNNSPTPCVEIYVHLYEFLHRNLFSKLSYEDKLSELSELKEVANASFKNNCFFRASKIFQNINYRFNYGDIFGGESAKAQEFLNEHNPALLNKLLDLKLASHNNLAICKYKLGRFYTSYEVSGKVLKEIAPNNHKALYIHGKSCISLKYYDEAIANLKILCEKCPDNQEFIELLKEAENYSSQELNKKKCMYKKMFFHEDENK